MKLPTIIYRAMSFEENMDMIAMFISQEIIRDQKPNTDFFKNHYTELSAINFSEDMTSEQISELLQSILLNSWTKDMEDSEQKIKDIQSNWDTINDNVMLDLSKRLNIKWPEDTLNIQARAGVMFYCPRYISYRTFDTNINADTNRMRSVAIHEITHFLYFEKWKELFNDYNEANYNYPNIVWYLSEAIIDPLLNNETFTKYTNEEIKSNNDMINIKINNQSIVNVLQNFINNNPIEEALKISYDFFLKYENEIKSNSTSS